MKNQFKKQFPSFLLETRNCFSLLSSYIIFQYISLQEHQYNLMIPVSKGQKAVRACTIRLLNLGHAKYEVQNIQWMFVLHRPKRSVDSSDLRSKSADFESYRKLNFDEPVPVDFAVKHNRYRAKTRIHPDRARFFELRGQAPLSVVVDAVLENCSLEEVQKARKKAKLKGTIKKLTPAPVKELAKKVLRKIR